MVSKRRRRVGKTPMEMRAITMAEALYESRGLAYAAQIPGMAHMLVVFAENELRLSQRAPREE